MNSVSIARKKLDAANAASNHLVTQVAAYALTLASCTMTMHFFATLFRPNLFAGYLVGGVIVILIAVTASLHAEYGQNRDAIIERLTFQSDRKPDMGRGRWQRASAGLLMLGLVMIAASTWSNQAFMKNSSANSKVDFQLVDVELGRVENAVRGHHEALSEPQEAGGRAEDFQRRVSLATTEADIKALQIEAGAKVDGDVGRESQAQFKEYLEVLRIADDQAVASLGARRTELTQSLSALEDKRTSLLLKQAGLEKVGYGAAAGIVFWFLSLLVDVGAWCLHSSLARYDHTHKLARLSKRVKSSDAAVFQPLTIFEHHKAS